MKEQGRLRPQHVSIGKLNNARAALDIARTSRGIHGANGITLEYPIMRHMTNLESVVTYEGTEEVHTLVIGEALTGLRAYTYRMVALIDESDSVLVVIDTQPGFLDKLDPSLAATLEGRIAWLVRLALALDVPIVVTQEEPDRNGGPATSVDTLVPPDVTRHTKPAFGLCGVPADRGRCRTLRSRHRGAVWPRNRRVRRAIGIWPGRSWDARRGRQ